MPTLKWFPQHGHPRTFVLYKPVTTIGRALGNDVAVGSQKVAETHIQILFDGRDFNLEEVDKQAEILINGKKKRRARLAHGDRLTLGDAELAFSIFDEPPAPRPAPSTSETGTNISTTGTDLLAQQQLAGVRKLHEFSEKLMTLRIDELLEAMLDAVIDVTGAEKGLILLMDDAFTGNVNEKGEGGENAPPKPQIRASRNVRREAITDPSGQISDSIVRRVLDTGRPLIVSDALTDAQFGSSESVVALKLSSVMCAPLVAQGHVSGALYVGNDRIKGLFQRSQLDLLSIFAGQASLILQNAMLLSALRADKDKLVAELSDKRFGEIIGVCGSMMEVFRKLQKVATTDISVLITGETGTGKELIAREVHRRSNRESGPFVVINCGAIPENLIESELFGHVKGAFTGAIASRPGKFQAADKGTLFLDEIGELPLNLQVKLLRVLQEETIRRLGDTKDVKVNVRIITATHRDLTAETKAGRFREDLFYRINVLQLVVPPLRERREDIGLLLDHFLARNNLRLGTQIRGLTHDARKVLLEYSWPGNVRELENTVERAMVLAEGDVIDVRDLPERLREALDPVQAKLASGELSIKKTVAAIEEILIRRALTKTKGNRTRAAELLEISHRALLYKLKDYKIEGL